MITTDFVREVSGLARLAPDPATLERRAQELGRILAYVEQLGNGLPPHAEGSVQRRADQPDACMPDPVLACSAGRVDRLVRVPPVRGEET